jgi:hypothetical protein
MSTACISTPGGASGQRRFVDADDLVPLGQEVVRDHVTEDAGDARDQDLHRADLPSRCA